MPALVVFVSTVAEHVAITTASPRGFCCVNNVAFVDITARRHIKASVVILLNLPIRRLRLRHLTAVPPLNFERYSHQNQALLAYKDLRAWSQ